MDSDFMNNLTNAMKNSNIPDDLKNLMNNFKNNNSNTVDSNSNQNSNNSNQDFIKNIMNMMNHNVDNNSTNTVNTDNTTPNIDINMLLKMKAIMDKINSNKNDPRSNLLLSLKPYLKESRKNKVEQYVQFLNMSKVIEAFGQTGGENTK